MSLNARRYTLKYAAKIEVPKQPKLSDAEHASLVLLDRALLEEHARHAARLADLRAVAARLQPLEPIVRAAVAQGANIDLAAIRLSPRRYCSSESAHRGVEALVIRPHDTLSDWRNDTQNALADVMLLAGWRIVYVSAHGSTVMRDVVVFMRGQQAVETSCLRTWTLAAIENGHITAATAGNHPAMDTGKPLTAAAASQEATA
ncbi:hypothetical protein [uncultured Pseudacidovorax sp.]|uniref:hypothetical protein n=1 Tax=uncultured Pseudacidovorax sp. TaxID=679313 RepID=UPI0025D65C58|nr:hypothetical protein [uncultured Pseudacidovorax sp.]